MDTLPATTSTARKKPMLFVGSLARESNESPMLKAFCLVASSVLFSDRAILRTGVFLLKLGLN
jgi:hypothetical protein